MLRVLRNPLALDPIPPTVPRIQHSVRRVRAGRNVYPELSNNVVQRDTLQPEETDERLAEMYCLAKKHAVNYIGRQAYRTYKNSGENALEKEMIGIHIKSHELSKNVMLPDVYPIVGMVFDHELLPREANAFWLEEFVKGWDNFRKRVIATTNHDDLSRMNVKICHDKINLRVAEFAKKTWDRVIAIKFVTKSKYLEIDGAAPGIFSGLKLMRIDLMGGWNNQLHAEANEGLREFIDHLDGVRHVLQGVPRMGTKLLLLRCRSNIKGFSLDDSVAKELLKESEQEEETVQEASSDSDSSSDSEEEDDTTPASTDNAPASEEVVVPTVDTKPAATDSASASGGPLEEAAAGVDEN
jgi:hypothetical protein